MEVGLLAKPAENPKPEAAKPQPNGIGLAVGDANYAPFQKFGKVFAVKSKICGEGRLCPKSSPVADSAASIE